MAVELPLEPLEYPDLRNVSHHQMEGVTEALRSSQGDALPRQVVTW